MLRTGELHPPEEGLTPRFDAQVSPNAGGLLQSALVPPSAGLAPASHREHQDAIRGLIIRPSMGGVGC